MCGIICRAIGGEKMTKKSYIRLAMLLSFAYFVSYLTRLNYGALILEMEKTLHISNTLLSMAVSGSAVTYGFGQIISGVLGDKFSPKKLICGGLITTAAMNFLIPVVAPNVYLMTAAWCVNGAAQAMMWPPIVVIMTEALTAKEYNKSSILVSCGGYLGNIAVYLLAPLMIRISTWRTVFFICGGCAVLMAFTVCFLCPDVKSGTKAGKPENKKIGIKGFITPFLVLVMLGVAFEGALREGILTWMPTYISQTYDLGSEISILSGVILPVFSTASVVLSMVIYEHFIKNPLHYATLVLVIGAVFSGVLYAFTGKSAAISVASFAIITAAMHGASLMLTTMIPPLYLKKGNVSTVSGVINAATYVGSALSGVGTAALSSAFGWRAVTGVWVTFALISAACCFIASKYDLSDI